jgi:hypothetical protein
MRPDDAFWAARIVARFSNDAIRVIVERAHYSDPRATDYVTGTIIKRRDKVVAYWLTQVNPVVDFALSDRGELTFANAAEQAGVAAPASSYRLQWARFDNTTGLRRTSAAWRSEPRAQAPARWRRTTPAIRRESGRSSSPQFRGRSRSRCTSSGWAGWKIVGLVGCGRGHCRIRAQSILSERICRFTPQSGSP